jgi:hypothetical protein
LTSTVEKAGVISTEKSMLNPLQRTENTASWRNLAEDWKRGEEKHLQMELILNPKWLWWGKALQFHNNSLDSVNKKTTIYPIWMWHKYISLYGSDKALWSTLSLKWSSNRIS